MIKLAVVLTKDVPFDSWKAFLVLKNLSRESRGDLKYIKNLELSPMKNFEFFKEKVSFPLVSLNRLSVKNNWTSWRKRWT